MEGADGFHITKLSISGVDEVVNRLAVPREGRWLFPALSELTIDVKDLRPGVLARMVKARHNAASSRITRLVINNMRDNLEQDVTTAVGILGFGRVFIDP